MTTNDTARLLLNDFLAAIAAGDETLAERAVDDINSFCSLGGRMPWTVEERLAVAAFEAYGIEQPTHPVEDR